MTPSVPTAARSRDGFTLIELMVVIAIIAVVVGTVFVTLGTTLDQAENQRGKVAINALEAGLSARMSKFADLVTKAEQDQVVGSGWFNVRLRTSNLRDGYNNLPSGTPANAPSTINTYQARSLVLHDLYRGLFPQRLEDLLGLDGVTENSVAGPDLGDDDSPLLQEFIDRNSAIADKEAIRAAINAGGTFGAADADPAPATVNSELLYLMLFSQPGLDARQVTDAEFPSQFIIDSDSDGIPELYDPFEQRLVFYNAPTRLIRPGGLGAAVTPSQFAIAKRIDNSLVGFDINAPEYAGGLPQTVVDIGGAYNSTATHPLNIDPLDRLRLLDGAFTAAFAVGGYYGNPPTTATTLQPFTETYFWTRNTGYSPLIISPGQDASLGFASPTDLTDGGSNGTGIDQADRLGFVPPGELDAISDNLTNKKRVLR